MVIELGICVCACCQGLEPVATTVPSVRLMKILWTHHCIRELAQGLYLDGNLKLAGFDPLPSDMDRWART